MRRFVAPCCAGLVIIGCKQDVPAARTGTRAVPSGTHVDSSVAAPVSNGWNPGAGPVLLVAGAAPDEAIVFFGASNGTTAAVDTGAVDQATATLFGRDSSRFTATLELPAGNDNAECRIWPLRNLHATVGAGAWSVGFLSTNVTAIPLDSVDALPARDSMALAAEASRLASVVTANTSPAFQGLRFTAHDIRRFQAAPGVQALAAQLIRRVNQEASPQEEQTLVIAERDSGVTTGRYQLAYAERSFGTEDEVVSTELVGAVRLGPSGTPSLVVARDSDAGLAYTLIERTGPRQWVTRWTSSTAKCAD
ncbi:MAG TPA: hypothetical protein VF491_12920 [Vicinamibacterales bacterium]